jgi:hypothetical protein
MLSVKNRQRAEFICSRIAVRGEVSLEDMIWIQKMAGANTGVREWLRKAQRLAFRAVEDKTNPMDQFCDDMGIGDPDPSNHVTGFSGADDIVDWFKQDRPDDWRQRD